MRYGILADMLHKAGHNVTWWTSAFNHHRKEFRQINDREVYYSETYRNILLFSIGYKKNVSLRRIFDHFQLGFAFFDAAAKEEKPDVILTGLPTIELCYYSIKYGQKFNIPVVVDIQDLWPDVFLDVLPLWLRPFGEVLLSPYYFMLKYICRNARALIGLTDGYVSWGLGHSRRVKSYDDQVFPLGYSSSLPSKKELNVAQDFWRNIGLLNCNKFMVIFIGSLGRQFDLKTVIDAAQILSSHEIVFVICGDGENRKLYESMSSHLDNVIFPGWIDRAGIHTLLHMANIGLAPYVNSNNFKSNIPNKPIEYLSAGLPILSGIEGAIAELINENDCGYQYEYGSAESLSAVLIGIMSNLQGLKNKSENAKKLYSDRFDADIVYNSLISFLVDVQSK
jgi:glycosyltransferase involved in cell wall biosynthesis